MVDPEVDADEVEVLQFVAARRQTMVGVPAEKDVECGVVYCIVVIRTGGWRLVKHVFESDLEADFDRVGIGRESFEAEDDWRLWLDWYCSCNLSAPRLQALTRPLTGS